MSDPARLDELERNLTRLARELADARRELATLRAAAPETAGAPESTTASASTPPAPPIAQPVLDEWPPRAAKPRSRQAPVKTATDQTTEQMVGRYATLAIGVLTVVMGAGALVSWAVRHGWLGPWVRVLLGAILAMSLAVLGRWLRIRGDRSYGNALLALSLAVTHVVAWGAGPRLQLVPSWVALLVAAAASGAIGVLAWREGEQKLLALGIGGALLAPFAMTVGTPPAAILAPFGAIIIATAIRATGARPWWYVAGVVMFFTMLYTIALVAARYQPAWLQRDLGPIFAFSLALIALAWSRVPTRPWTGVWALLFMSFGLLTVAMRFGATLPFGVFTAAPELPLLAIGGTVVTFVLVRDMAARATLAWLVIVIGVPWLFLQSTVLRRIPDLYVVNGAIVALWAAMYAVAARAERADRRAALLAVCGLATLAALVLVLRDNRDLVAPLLAVHAVFFAWITRREGPVPALVASTVSIIVAYGSAMEQLQRHPGFTAQPFISVASFGVGCAVAAAFWARQLGAPFEGALGGLLPDNRRTGRISAAILAFGWGHLELAQAFSADAARFLLIVYYAACGVLLIQLGRTYAEERTRQVGLGLSLIAGLMAVVNASGIANVGLRVGSYLAAGGFLLGVAWLYGRIEERGGGARGRGPREEGT